MAVNPSDILRITAKMSYGVGGGALQNVMHWQHNGVGIVTDASAVINVGLMLEQIYGHVRPQTAPIVQYLTFDVFNVTQSLITGFATWPTFTVGTGLGAAVSPQVSALIFLNTAVSKVQGRVYVSGATENDVTDGVWVAAALTNLALFAGELLVQQAFGGLRMDYVVLNRTLGTFTIPVGAVVKALARTQRRRSIGFGA